MRIILINHFPLDGSGSGTYTKNIAIHLVKKGHQVCVVMPENEKDFKRYEGIVYYPVYFTYKEKINEALPFNFPCFTSHPRSDMTFGELSDKQFSAYMLSFEKTIGTAVDEFKPDIIHAQHIWLLSYSASLTKIPYVITAHGTDLMGCDEFPKYKEYAVQAACGAKKIITISKDSDELVKEKFPESAYKSVIVKNGYDPAVFYPEKIEAVDLLSEFGIMPQKYLVFFAGKLAHFKGVDVLLEAAKQYEGEYKNQIVTVIAGDGELSGMLKKKRAEYELQNVHFLGNLPQPVLRKFYSAADVTAVPSRREPFGLVAIEALACGSPVVATDQGGLSDFINEKVGALADVDDAVGLADCICDIITKRNCYELRNYVAEYAYNNYSQGKIIDDVIHIYETALK